MIKPAGSNAYITFSRYPVLSIYISAIQGISGRRAFSWCKSSGVKIIPVGLSGNTFFVAYPPNMRTYVAEYNGVGGDRLNGFLKAIPIINLFLSIWSLTVGSVPPQFPDRSIVGENLFHHIYKHIIVSRSSVLWVIAIPG